MSAQLPPPKVDDQTIQLDTSNRLKIKATPKQFAMLAANYSTSSTTDVSTGNGVTITALGPAIEVRGGAIIASNTLSDGATFQIYRSKQGVPAQGSAPNGGDVSVYSTTVTNSASVIQAEEAVAFDFVDTGLVIGTVYSYYSTITAVTGGNASVLGTTNQHTIIAENSA